MSVIVKVYKVGMLIKAIKYIFSFIKVHKRLFVQVEYLRHITQLQVGEVALINLSHTSYALLQLYSYTSYALRRKEQLSLIRVQVYLHDNSHLDALGLSFRSFRRFWDSRCLVLDVRIIKQR